MKILQVARCFYPMIGGIEKVILDLSRQLVKKGYECAVVTLNRSLNDKSKYFPTFEELERIKVHRIPFFGSKRYFIASRVLEYLRDYDIVHIHGIDFFVDFLTITKFLHKKRIVVSTHGGFFHTKWLYPLKQLYFNTVTRFILSRVDKTICVSSSDYNLFSKITRNLILIENGVEISKLITLQKNIQKGLLIYIGRIDVHKGIDDLINVVSLIKKRHPEVKLLLIGPDVEGNRMEYEKLIMQKSLKNTVQFLGQVPEEKVYHYLEKACFFVSASKYEGFGISVVEAMASGTVPILNNIKPFNDFLINGKNGFIIDFSNPKTASKMIVSALEISEPDFKNMGICARNTAMKYSWANVTKRYEAVYKSVIEGIS